MSCYAGHDCECNRCNPHKRPAQKEVPVTSADCKIIQPNGDYYFINKTLLIRFNRIRYLNKIKELHYYKLEVYEAIKRTNDDDLLRIWANELTLIEYALQRAWGFAEDSQFHRFWTAPKCTCPKLDNEDAYPSGYYVYALNCPLHGY